MASYEFNVKNMNASYKLMSASERFAEESQRAAEKITNKLDQMALHLQANNIAAARKMWYRNKWIRYYVPSAVQKILFPSSKK